MKEALVLLVTAALASSQRLTYKTDPAWLKFKKDFQYFSPSPHEESRRYVIFRSNVDMIHRVNGRKLTYQVGINEFSNLTFKEFEASYLINRSKRRGLGLKAPSMFTASNGPTTGIPDQLDWRTKNVVTPVKKQSGFFPWPRKCGACWAFSATGAIEGALAKKTGTLISLSEQQLLDCAPMTYGCDGSDGVDYAFAYVMRQRKSPGGIQTAESYPYVAKKGPKCNFEPTQVAAYMETFARVTPTEDALKAAVYRNGPVSVHIKVANAAFYKYKRGVYTDDDCGHGEMIANHAMLVVGYGTEGEHDYWLVKNSWGARWGDKGYIKMARNHNNMCGIASEAYYPKGVNNVPSAPVPLKQSPASPANGKQSGNRSPAGVSPCSSSAMVAINTSLLMLLFAAIHSV